MREIQRKSALPTLWFELGAALVVAVVTYAVIAGYWWLGLAVTLAVFAVHLVPSVTHMTGTFLKSIDRLGIAWLLALSATLSVNTLTPDQVFSGSLGRAQIIRFAFLIAALLLVLPNIYKWLKSEERGLWLGGISKLFLSYVGVALLSTVWSVGRIATLGKVFELTVALLIVFATAAQPEPEQKLKRLFFLTLSFAGVILFVNLVGYFVSPDDFRQYLRANDGYRMTAGFTSIPSNAISRLGAVIALSALAFSIERGLPFFARLLALLVFGFGCLFPVLAEGRTGVAALLLGALVLVLARRPLLSLLFLPVGAYAAASYLDTFLEFFRRGQTDELFLSLTGRVDWWLAGLNTFLQQPLTGFGYGVGSRVVFTDLERGGTAFIHNGFLEVALGVGIIGFALWLVMLLRWFFGVSRKLLAGRDTAIYSFGVPVLFATILSSGAGGWLSIEFGLFLVVMVLLDLQNAPGPARAGAEA